MAPDVFHRTEPRVALGYDAAGVARGKALKAALDGRAFVQDLDACVSWAARRPDLSPDLAVVGFCFGGVLALIAGSRPGVTYVGSFYGAGVPTLTLGGARTVLEGLSEVHARVDLFYGGTDPSIPREDREAVRGALEGAGVPVRAHVWEQAGHGFFCDRRAAHDPEAAAEAWRLLRAALSTR